MTLTYAEVTEAAMGVVDPVRALRGAERDGLIRYRGYMTGDRYEVEIGGRRRILPQDQVADVVARLRAVAELGSAGVRAELLDLREDGTHVLEVDGRPVELAPGRVVSWCGGYAAAARGVGQEHAGDDQMDAIAVLFEQPSLDDQCRMVILGLMHGRGEDNAVSTAGLARRIGEVTGTKPPAKKTVVDNLMFGDYFGSGLSENMIKAFGMRWSLTGGGVQCVVQADSGEVVNPLPEMPGLARLRRIVRAARSGWLRYVGEPAPNKARWREKYQLTVGQHGYAVPADGLDAWLDGIAAFHAVRG